MLLIASPIHTSLLDASSVTEFMKPYTTVLIEGKNAIQGNKDRTDPFRKLVDLPEVSSSPDKEPGEERDESSEWYVEEMDEGVDYYMFPRTMGYLVLEQQYLM